MKALSRVLGVRTDDWRPAEREAFQNFAATLSLVEELTRMDTDRKAGVTENHPRQGRRRRKQILETDAEARAPARRDD